MFQCVKEVSANTHRELTKKITRRGGFLEKTDEVIARLFFIRWKLPVLSIYFLWKIEDQRKYFSRVFPFKYNRGVFFFFNNIVSFPFHMFIHIINKYVLCDIHCHNYSTAISIYISFIMPLSKIGAPCQSALTKSLWKCSHFTAEKHTA